MNYVYTRRGLLEKYCQNFYNPPCHHCSSSITIKINMKNKSIFSFRMDLKMYSPVCCQPLEYTVIYFQLINQRTALNLIKICYKKQHRNILAVICFSAAGFFIFYLIFRGLNTCRDHAFINTIVGWLTACVHEFLPPFGNVLTAEML